MLLLGENDILTAGIDWEKSIQIIEDTVRCLAARDFSQPVKPYLRYRNVNNRIIAMPAFVGGNVNRAGIKWIASFPDNVTKGLARAHSVLILNDADTGQPLATICTPLLSIIRTVAVSGMMIKQFASNRSLHEVNVGIIGFGPIGQYHLKMCASLLGSKINKVFLYDVRPIDPALLQGYASVEVVRRWEDAYLDADLVITCTVADAPYIDKHPKRSSLHLNVSLRDYKTCVYDWFKNSIIVDDWQEVCREKTDIEMMHLEKGLRENCTKSIIDVVQHNCLEQYDEQLPIMFNPMGMAVFDIAIGDYYYRSIKELRK